MIAVRYGISEEKIDHAECFNGVQIALSEVSLSQTCAEGWAILFKKQPASVSAVLYHTLSLTSREQL